MARSSPNAAPSRPPPGPPRCFAPRLFDRVGLLEERFESYLEDVDFGLRCAARGIAGVYEPGAVAWHRGSAALGRWHPETVRRIARNQVFLLARHYPAPLLARWIWPILTAHRCGAAWRCATAPAWHGLRGVVARRAPAFRASRKYGARSTRTSASHCCRSQERLIRQIQSSTGYDAYWRLYFLLDRRWGIVDTWPSIGIVIVTYNSARRNRRVPGRRRSPPAPKWWWWITARTMARIAEVARRGVRSIANSGQSRLRRRRQSGLSRASNCPYVLLLESRCRAARPASSRCAKPASCRAPPAPAGCCWMPQGRPQVGFMVRRFPTPAALILEALLLNRVWPNNPVNRRYRALDLNASTRRSSGTAGRARFSWSGARFGRNWAGSMKAFIPSGSKTSISAGARPTAGYLLYYVPAAVAKHTGAHSISQLTVEMRRFYWYGSLLRYYSQALSSVGLPGGVSGCCNGLVLRRLRRSAAQPEPAAHGSLRESRAACQPVLFFRLAGRDRLRLVPN